MKQPSFLYRNSLSIVFVLLMLFTWTAQAYTGWKEYNEERSEKKLSTIRFIPYLSTGHFIEATFENWESEFFQMGLYVVLTVFLRQKGSSESKSLTGKEAVDREPKKYKNAPWPVLKGGWISALYQYSLSIAFAGLFLFSFFAHAYGTMKDMNEERMANAESLLSYADTLCEVRFWFESFQNWQSEFLSVASIVLLSIYLRHKGSPESKPVDAPHDETGE